MVFDLFKAFLFDFDGTFADTATDLIASANYIYTKYNKSSISYEQGRAIASDGTRAFLNLRFEDLERALKDIRNGKYQITLRIEKLVPREVSSAKSKFLNQDP